MNIKIIDKTLALMTAACTIGAALSLAVMAFVGAGDIFGINVFQKGIPGANQIAEEALAAAFFLGLPFAQRKAAHVDVDILTSLFSQKVQNRLLAFTQLFVACMLTFLAWKAFDAAQRSYQVNETTMGALIFAIWPVKTAMVVGLVVSIFEALRQVILSIFAPVTNQQQMSQAI